MVNILVTGGAGFIPSCMIDKLLEKPQYNIVAIDNFLTGDARKLPANSERFKFIKGDVNDYHTLSSIMLSNKFDYVFHYAAVVGVKRTTDNPILVLEDIYGIKNILELSKNTGVKRVFFSSSSEVYGEPVELPQRELTTPLNSKLPYAIVKNLGEAYCRSYYQEYGLEYTIFRFFNTYGPKQSPDFVMSKFIKAALKNEDISIYGDGSQTRTFCCYKDNIEACVRAFEENLFVNNVINVGNDIEMKIIDLAKLIIKETNSQSKIVHLPPLAEGDMTRRQPEISKMVSIINRSLTPIEVGIKEILDSEIFKQLNNIQ